ncbi:hypothetical protein Mesil_0302 [Allomeiothermus silvanus DSM 9946]|uniref:Uncharacterized protein n=1 Tax=Allomeiothermus silvanus (strain ATCC 700542 / DSM 9946 / NBRC 106475 / NCIMB 13440 / VI-R2) TaxID=526227 RepID=D7BHK5_ALLS1|nr:hypothetical protein [Allomeiothermus silvanus]ADH62243.1 hypothetical protein Mesil_0302 [Allomeiothermus silvanus DSM 9946]
MKPSRVVAFARKIRIMGRAGYVLKPSPTNPHVKRWQRADVQDAALIDEKTASTLQSIHVQRSSYNPKRHITEAMLDLPRRMGKMLSFDRIATLARHQTDGLDRHGALEPIKQLIERKVTTGGQLGADHLLVMEELLRERDRHPLMVDSFSADYNDFPRWAEQTREWVRRNGGAIVGAVPRTSAFDWDPAWGPPPSRSGLGIGKEGTLLIAPPRNRAAEFARLYAQAAKKDYVADGLKAELDELLRTGRDPQRTKYLLELTEGLVYDDPEFDWRGELNKRYHADRYRREPGRWLAEEAWHDPDGRPLLLRRARRRPRDFRGAGNRHLLQGQPHRRGRPLSGPRFRRPGADRLYWGHEAMGRTAVRAAARALPRQGPRRIRHGRDPLEAGGLRRGAAVAARLRLGLPRPLQGRGWRLGRVALPVPERQGLPRKRALPAHPRGHAARLGQGAPGIAV